MSRIIQTGRLGRAALLVAGALSLLGSAGLHPEPAGRVPACADAPTLASRSAGSSGAAAALNTNSGCRAVAHTCLVCLLHFSTSIVVTAALDSAPPATSERALASEDLLLPQIPSNPRVGRSPPVSC